MAVPIQPITILVIPESSPDRFHTCGGGQVDTYSFTNPISQFASTGHCWALGKRAGRSTVDLPRLHMSSILRAGGFEGWAGPGCEFGQGWGHERADTPSWGNTCPVSISCVPPGSSLTVHLERGHPADRHPTAVQPNPKSTPRPGVTHSIHKQKSGGLIPGRIRPMSRPTSVLPGSSVLEKGVGGEETLGFSETTRGCACQLSRACWAGGVQPESFPSRRWS